MESAEDDRPPGRKMSLLNGRHVKYLKRVTEVLPAAMSSLDTRRATLAFFAVSGLDVLGTIDGKNEEAFSQVRRRALVDWLYSLQIERSKFPPGPEFAASHGGFRGSTFAVLAPAAEKNRNCNAFKPGGGDHDCRLAASTDVANLAMTYTCLATLAVLGDDLSRVDKPAISASLKALQSPDGSFVSSVESPENDMRSENIPWPAPRLCALKLANFSEQKINRWLAFSLPFPVRFVFCACAVAAILDDWSGVDKDSATDFILKSLSYEGAFGQRPFLESHGGSTYCAVASLALMGRLGDMGPARRDRLIRWCLNRLTSSGCCSSFPCDDYPGQVGFQGRPNKDSDTCYTFWVGAALRILEPDEPYVAEICKRAVDFVLCTQDPIVGGLGKIQDNPPDPLHTYLGLSGLSLFAADDLGLTKVDPTLNVTERTMTFLRSLKNLGKHDTAGS